MTPDRSHSDTVGGRVANNSLKKLCGTIQRQYARTSCINFFNKTYQNNLWSLGPTHWPFLLNEFECIQYVSSSICQIGPFCATPSICWNFLHKYHKIVSNFLQNFLKFGLCSPFLCIFLAHDHVELVNFRLDEGDDSSTRNLGSPRKRIASNAL